MLKKIFPVWHNWKAVRAMKVSGNLFSHFVNVLLTLILVEPQQNVNVLYIVLF